MKPRVKEFAFWPPGFRGELDLPVRFDSMQRLKMNPLTSSSPSFSGVIWRVTYRGAWGDAIYSYEQNCI